MPRPEFPRVRPFEIARLGWRFDDSRDVSTDDSDAAVAGMFTHTFDTWITSTGQDRRKHCSLNDKVVEEIERRWQLEIETNPHANRNDWEAAGGAVVDDVCFDPRLDTIRFVVTEAGPPERILGCWVLQNITILSETPRELSIRAMPLAGVPAGFGMSMPETWAVIARFMIEHDLPIAGDVQVLSLDEIYIPDTNDADMVPTSDNQLLDYWQEISPAVDEVERSTRRETPKRLRAVRKRPDGEAASPLSLGPDDPS